MSLDLNANREMQENNMHSIMSKNNQERRSFYSK